MRSTRAAMAGPGPPRSAMRGSVRLAADVALVELLEHDDRLPRGERLVPADAADVEAGALGVAVDHLGPRRQPHLGRGPP